MSDSGMMLPFERRFTTRTDVDVHIGILTGEIELKKCSQALQDQHARLRQCRDYIREYEGRSKVVPMMMNDFQISEAQAYRDYNDAISVFNSVSKSEGLDMYVDHTLSDLKEVYRKALAAKDYRSAVSALKEKVRIMKDFFGTNEKRIYDELQNPVVITRYIPNENLPEDWRARAEKIIERKKRKTLDISDAEIISDEPNEPTA